MTRQEAKQLLTDNSDPRSITEKVDLIFNQFQREKHNSLKTFIKISKFAKKCFISESGYFGDGKNRLKQIVYRHLDFHLVQKTVVPKYRKVSLNS